MVLTADVKTLTDVAVAATGRIIRKVNVGEDGALNRTGCAKSLTILVNKRASSYATVQRGEAHFEAFVKSLGADPSYAVLYTSMYAAEPGDIADAIWYDSTTMMMLFAILILLAMFWFMLHFMLKIQSVTISEVKLKND